MKNRCALLFLALASSQAQTPVDLVTLRYIDLAQGTGAAAAPGKRFTVHYTGRLKDGTKFESSVDRNEPFKFVQGRRQVITGWDIGFEGMKVGGKRRLIIPYQLAYGEQGSGPIPPKAELTFDMELLDVADALPSPPAIDLLIPYADLETRVIAFAKAKPDAPGLGDIVKANRTTLAAATEEPAPALSGSVVEQLTGSFAAVHKQLDSARNGFLSGDAEVMGKPSTRRGLFTALIANIAEQLGKAEGTK
ncbi:MAG: hypothetical protein QOJ99_6207 [Bryobacterales bacterium]|jgi:hypothetical protein|nr:hypothetical protein [Bryobacterales bacterium]